LLDFANFANLNVAYNFFYLELVLMLRTIDIDIYVHITFWYTDLTASSNSNAWFPKFDVCVNIWNFCLKRRCADLLNQNFKRKGISVGRERQSL
jgi:hypothetical protein